MSSTPPPESDGPEDAAFRRPGAEPGPSWEPVLDDDPPPARRWRPGLAFALLMGVVALVAGWWLLSGRTAPRDLPPEPDPSLILQPAPSWPTDLSPPSNDAGFGPPSLKEPQPGGLPDPDRGVRLDGDEARVQRIDADTAVVVTGGELYHVNLAEGRIDWQVPSLGRVAVSPLSGAVVEVAPDGAAVSRVVVTGDELSRGRLKGNPALCGDLLFDISETGIDVYDALR